MTAQSSRVLVAAKSCFALFKRHSLAGRLSPRTPLGQGAFSGAHRFGNVAVLALAMRTERTPERQRCCQNIKPHDADSPAQRLWINGWVKTRPNPTANRFIL